MITEFLDKYEIRFINSNEFAKKIAQRNLLILNLNDIHHYMNDLVPNHKPEDLESVKALISNLREIQRYHQLINLFDMYD